jgi:hypothetical protein
VRHAHGYFKTLSGLVHFYNTRDVKAVCPGPFSEREALGLSQAEERAIVAFMQTLSDGVSDARRGPIPHRNVQRNEASSTSAPRQRLWPRARKRRTAINARHGTVKESDRETPSAPVR